MPSLRRTAAAAAAVLAFLGAASPAADARRADVAALQVGLRNLGMLSAIPDGIAGPQTRSAVRSLQRRRRLTVDGIAGPQTRRALGRWGRPRLGSRAVRIGRSGWDVAAVQFLLALRGFSPGAIDGAFGSATGRAVRAYQRSAGLGADGVAGPATIRALRAGRGGGPSGPVRFFRPVSGRVGDGFGWYSGRRHTGLDFPVAHGTRVAAAGRGVTLFAGFNTGGYGNLVVVKHRLGFTSWYAHLSRVTTWPGDRVVGGTRIGLAGSTGRSTGPHLHFEVRRYDAPIDPAPWMLATTARASASASGLRPRGHGAQVQRGVQRRFIDAELHGHFADGAP